MIEILDLIRLWFAAKIIEMAMVVLPDSDMTVVARRYIINACADLIAQLEED